MKREAVEGTALSAYEPNSCAMQWRSVADEKASCRGERRGVEDGIKCVTFKLLIFHHDSSSSTPVI